MYRAALGLAESLYGPYFAGRVLKRGCLGRLPATDIPSSYRNLFGKLR